MAWRVYNVKDQRKQFISEVQRREKTFTDIREEFGISRPIGDPEKNPGKGRGQSPR